MKVGGGGGGGGGASSERHGRLTPRAAEASTPRSFTRASAAFERHVGALRATVRPPTLTVFRPESRPGLESIDPAWHESHSMLLSPRAQQQKPEVARGTLTSNDRQLRRHLQWLPSMGDEAASFEPLSRQPVQPIPPLIPSPIPPPAAAGCGTPCSGLQGSGVLLSPRARRPTRASTPQAKAHGGGAATRREWTCGAVGAAPQKGLYTPSQNQVSSTPDWGSGRGTIPLSCERAGWYGRNQWT